MDVSGWMVVLDGVLRAHWFAKKKSGKGTIYSLRLRDSQDSQDSGTPETPKTPGLPRLRDSQDSRKTDGKSESNQSQVS